MDSPKAQEIILRSMWKILLQVYPRTHRKLYMLKRLCEIWSKQTNIRMDVQTIPHNYRQDKFTQAQIDELIRLCVDLRFSKIDQISPQAVYYYNCFHSDDLYDIMAVNNE